MIEIVTEQDRNLKNLKQIGTPREEHKIYIENMAYLKMKEDSYANKKLFVLMGHTERMEGRYATFVEAVVPVRNPEFSGNVPKWNNEMWSQVFRDIKRVYEDMIIVGWAMDIRGMSVRITPELERAHREHFGGMHQIMFVSDSLEQEETVYMYKEKKLVPKDGFYIYYRARKAAEAPQAQSVKAEDFQVIDFNKEKHLPDIDFVEEKDRGKSGRYRSVLQEADKKEESGTTGLAIAVAMLVFVLVVGVYENREAVLGGWNNATEAGATPQESSDDTEKDTEAEADPTELESNLPVEGL